MELMLPLHSATAKEESRPYFFSKITYVYKQKRAEEMKKTLRTE
jgi:hypothetical protein